MIQLRRLVKWFTPGIGVKRWLILLLVGVLLTAGSLSLGIFKLIETQITEEVLPVISWTEIVGGMMIGVILVVFGLVRLTRIILAPYRRHQHGPVVDMVYAHSKRNRGLKVVAIGGGTGLPSVLRGLKSFTGNITAVVTVADDGGSSGRLRREFGVLPPGDLRNNIAALADDESLMTRLFQYRFSSGDLSGHAFGNLFITALAGVTGSLETALIETERVLNIQGRVLPATLDDVTLSALLTPPGGKSPVHVRGEADITKAGGRIEQIMIEPAEAEGYAESINAILQADIVVIGPGSLYTSILPNLLVKGISEALRATGAYKIYVCNVAVQPGETDQYSVADHVLALEKHIGRGVFQTVLANNTYAELQGENSNTRYVPLVPLYHEVLQRYDVRYTDLIDPDRPWRHDPSKLAAAILNLSEEGKTGSTSSKTLFADAKVHST